MKSRPRELIDWRGQALSLSIGVAALISCVFLLRWGHPQSLIWITGLAMASLLHGSRSRLLAAQERLRLATEGTGIGIFDIDLTRKTAYASPALLVLAQIPVSSQPLSFSIWRRHLPADLVNEHIHFFQTRIAGGLTTYEREISIPRPQGDPLRLALCVHITRAGGQAVRLHGTCVDVTERKAVHVRLLQTQERLGQQLNDLHHLHELSTQLLETPRLGAQLEMILGTLAHFHDSPWGLISLYDPDTHRLETGASLGIGPETLARMGPSEASACAMACRGQSRVIIEDTERDLHEAACRALARALGCRAIHSTPLTSSQGERLGALTIFLGEPRRATARECTLADICARKAVLFIERARARQELQDSRMRFETVLDATGAPFVILEPVRENEAIVNFRWTYINRSAARTLGQPRAELVGQNVLGTLTGLSATSPEFGHCVQVIETHHTVEFDTVRGKGGKARWFHCIASPIHDSVAIWFTDISERIRNEQLLRHSDRRKDEFLATLAHELRNPLAPIRQAVQLLMSAQTTHAQRRWACEVTDRQVRRMALLLDDLLDVPRIGRGTLTLKKTLNDVDDIVAAAIETARPNIDAKRHHLRVQRSPTPVVVQADALRLAQVVANLLNNAAKYTDPDGVIEIGIRREADQVIIDVRDNGIGIPPAAIPEVFRMFSQLRHAGDKREGGLGIGLALSKGLVELHGGTLTAHSEGTGRGSVFTVHLPQGNTGQPPALPAPAPVLPQPARHPSTVLIADDNRDALDTLATLLEMDGHETHRAYDGLQALALWHAVRPDVCLLDIDMSGRTGYQVAREIRGLPGGDATLLVAVTGWGQAQDRQASLDAGFDLHLTKPVSPEQIARLLRTQDQDRALARDVTDPTGA